MINDQTFDEQMERIKLITGKRKQAELAVLFGVKPAAVSDARRRGRIPASWLAILTRYRKINPEWVLSGNGPVLMSCPPAEHRYETGDERAERLLDEETLRRLPSRMLADELVRRIAVVQRNVFCGGD